MPENYETKGFTPHFKSAGFTLIELLVVVGILAFIGGILFSVIDPINNIKKANDSKRKNGISQIQKALEQYYQDHGKYPPNPGDYPPSIYKIKKFDGNTAEWGEEWNPYMSVLPKDPNDARNYVYFASSDGQAYYIYASLERTLDSQVCNGGAACSTLGTNDFPPPNACGEICNYGASSPNVSP